MAGLTAVALVLLLVGVAVRGTINELASDTFVLTDSADLGGPGPTTTLLLNALCCLPALLVLVRRAIDPTYVLRWHVSHLLMFLLATWITLSAAWASNKFDALLGVSTWWTAAAVLWAAGQLCRSWTRLRPVLGVAAGLMLIFVAQSLIYRYYEGPELLHYWETDPEIVARRQAEPDSFAIRQMDRTVHNGTQQAFFRSPNTFAAVSVFAALVTAGFVGARLLTRDEPAFAGGMAIAIVGLPLIVQWTGSRTAGATAALAAVALAAAWFGRDLLARRSRLAYAIGVVLFLLGVAAVVAIGMKTGGLLHDSLTFRWNYWVASWHLFQTHPWTGVGWANFGPHYLAYRLPVAAEEIKNPHNLFVSFATEIGVIGLALVVAWLARALWEVTRPVTPRGTSAVANQPWLSTAIGVAALFWLLRMVVLWPLTLTPSELTKTALFGLLLLVGLLLTVVRNVKDPTPDARPAPFLVYASVIGLLAFLLHNLVDFSIFETGPLLLFVLTLGGLLGTRHPGVAGRRPHTAAAIGGLAATFVALLAVAGLWAVPVMLAEYKADAAETKGRAAAEALRSGRTDFAAGLRNDAVALYREAIAASPVRNPDYAVRATRYMDGAAPNDVLAMLSVAVESDPADVQRYLNRARFGRSVKAPSVTYLSDYDQFVTRNPNDALVRIEYADALAEAGFIDRAKAQYRAALAANAALNPEEPRRLPETKVRDVEGRLK
jgi:hypothetical protein